MLSSQDLPGTLKDFGGALPPGHLLADGSAISRSLYADLFAAIGTTHGVGDGSTTFNLPDSRGRGTLGSGTGPSLTARTLGQQVGEESHVLTVAELATHLHADGGHAHSITAASFIGDSGIQFGGSTNTLFDTNQGGATLVGRGTNAASANIQNTGSGAAHNNVQPSLVVTKMVRY